MLKGVQGDGFAVPLHKYNTAVTRRLHGSEDGMSQAEKTKNTKKKVSIELELIKLVKSTHVGE